MNAYSKRLESLDIGLAPTVIAVGSIWKQAAPRRSEETHGWGLKTVLSKTGILTGYSQTLQPGAVQGFYDFKTIGDFLESKMDHRPRSFVRLKRSGDATLYA